MFHGNYCFAIAALLLTGSVAAAARPPEPLTPRPYHPGLPLTEYWVREQFQGVRAYWDGQRLLNTAGEPMPAPPGFTRDFPATPLEGALWMGRGATGRLFEILGRRRPDMNQWRHLYFMAFDVPAHPGPFETRLRALEHLLRDTPAAHLRLAPYVNAGSDAELHRHLERVIAAGGQGLVLYHRDAPYRHPGSDDILALRPQQQGEARVVAIITEAGRHHNAMTGLLVETASGRHLRLREGFSAALRARPPPIGSVVRYAYRGQTPQGAPRSPRFLEVRREGPGFVR